MNQDTLMTDIPLDDDVAILPDGWSDGDDIFNPESWSGAGGVTEEADTTEDSETEQEDVLTDDEETPTTGEEDTGEEGQSAEEEADDASGQTQEPVTKPSRILKLKVNHKQETVNIDEMSDDDLIAHIQKSKAYDQRVEADYRRKFREVYQEQLDAGMTEAAAKLIAKSEAGGREFSLTDEDEQTVGEVADSQNTDETDVRDTVREVEQLKALFPDFKEMPDEVAHAYADGVPLLTAYLAYRDKQNSKAADSLKRENKILKQNAASAAKAPVKGVSGGGKTHQKEDLWLKGFDSGSW